MPMFGTADGVAALPIACTYTHREGSPSPGAVVKVCPRAECDFQDVGAALAAATCGTTISIEARDPTTGAQQTYTANAVTATAACPADQWITVATDRVDDPSFPAEGQRITPCWAGKPALHGRPAYACPPGGAGVYMPKLISTSANTPVLAVDGASHWRFIGLEFATTTGKQEGAVVTTGSDAGGGDHIILDRVVAHGGDTADGQNTVDVEDGVKFADTTHGALVDSYLYDFICVNSCIDSHGVSLGGNGTRTEGPIKVVDNYIEASGENIFSGGGGDGGDSGCCTTDTDLELRRNHLYKPTFWQVSQGCDAGQPGCTCAPDGSKCSIPNPDPYSQTTKVIVKNNTEFKNGQRILLEGNVFENNWGGQSDQFGTAVLFGPRNQSRHAGGVKITATSDGSGTLVASSDFFTPDVVSSYCTVPGHCYVTYNGVVYEATSYLDARHVVVTPAPPASTAEPIDQCRPGGNPNATVTDVVFRDNRIKHMSRGMAIDTGRSTGCKDAPKQAARIVVHDNVFDDLDGLVWNLSSSACCAWSDGITISNSIDDPSVAVSSVQVAHDTILVRPSGTNPGTAGSLHVSNACGAACTTQLVNLDLRDNIGAAGMRDHATKDQSYCAQQKMTEPAATLLGCVSGNTWCWTNNLFSDEHVPDLGPPMQSALELNTPWPTSSPACEATALAAPSDYSGFAFASLNEADGGDYHLTTAFRGRASDGKDPGADIDAVNAAIAGVAP
ncbi:MAG TPA: hypothetical protein VLX92_14820 [Kofleriaceae bacterium]|nr:hypothetical protein [Kofleriaceae bacterium]